MLNTRSQFLYGLKITAGENYLSFVEASTPSQQRAATLHPIGYSLTSLRAELETALNAAGNQTYTVTLNQAARTFTISAPGNFNILINSGPFNGSSIWGVLGLGFSDLTGGNSYTTQPLGILYKPQFYLLDYVDGLNNQRPIDSVKNETSSGIVEVVRYGTRYLYEMTIDFITNIPQDPNGWIETDTTAIEKARAFLEYVTAQNVVDFYPDRDLPDFITLALHSTQQDSNGLGFKISEKQGLPGYYTTGILTFRKV
jgi:hypothetical protein